MLPLDSDRAWHNFGAVTSLLSLLISEVTRVQGDMFERIGDVTALRQRFVGYDEAPPAAKRTSAGTPKRSGKKRVEDRSTAGRERGDRR